MNPSFRCFDVGNAPALDRFVRPGTLSLKDLRDIANASTPTSHAPRQRVALGVLLLWHDHWEEAHAIAQSDEGDPDHDYLHGMVHRREGDFGNSKYWFRSAGVHAGFPAMTVRIVAAANDHALADKIIKDGVWSPSAFVDVVRDHSGGEEGFCRAVQAAEMMGFHAWLTGGPT